MDQDPIRSHAGKAFEPEAHGVLAGRAAGNRLKDRQAQGRFVEQGAVLRVDHRAHRVDERMVEKSAHRATQYRLAGKSLILLGHRAAEADALAGADNQRHACGHGLNPCNA